MIGNGETCKEVMSAVKKFTLSRSKGQEGARRAVVAVEEVAQASTDIRPTRSEAPLEMGEPAVPPPWVAQLFEDLDNRVGATVKTALQPLQEQVDKLSKDV
ncbi:hypothetical protein CJ030_MR2G019258 [Morella rubra]|uniref:Uncharacterized protein n=1 Tax=Morella rubra TaxID=262757 RepID=A0A6A1WK78_9ROSI|nr:hypothetical protein CJ030_MR2G019258 [Morella rubra]